MMRGLIVLFTAAIAFKILGRKQLRHHIFAISMTVLGVFVVGTTHYANNDATTTANPLVGIILIAIG
jgi:drug/metabolite transporter (DMT)-like permease